MGTESLEQAIEKAKRELGGRGTKKNIGWFFITAILFSLPLYIFLNISVSVYQSSYAFLAIGWFFIATIASNFIASAMFAGRTAELRLSLEIANEILKLSKERDM